MWGSFRILNNFLLYTLNIKKKELVLFNTFLLKRYYNSIFFLSNFSYFFLYFAIVYFLKLLLVFGLSSNVLNNIVNNYRSVFLFYCFYSLFFFNKVLIFNTLYFNNYLILHLFFKYNIFYILKFLLQYNILRYSLIIKYVKNNIYLTFIDFAGNVYFKLSSGFLGYKKGKDRRTTLALKSLFLKFFNYLEKDFMLKHKKLLISLDVFNILYLKNIPNNAYNIIYNYLNKEIFVNFKFMFCFISILFNKGHGYIRLKKPRRL